MALRMLKGAALTAFNTSVDNQATKRQEFETRNAEAADDATVEEVPSLSIDTDLLAVTNQVFPPCAYINQCRWMRRHLQKPREMPIANLVARVCEINGYLEEFPLKSDGSQPTKLPEDEILDILEYGSPGSWQTQFLLQGYDPQELSLQEFVNFCRILESVELPINQTETSTKKRKVSTTTKTSSTTKKKKTDGYYCMLHGHNLTHNSDECRVLKMQAKRMSQTYAAQHPSKKREYKENQELHAFLSDAVDTFMKKKVDNRKIAKKKQAKLNSIEENSTQFSSITDKDIRDFSVLNIEVIAINN